MNLVMRYDDLSRVWLAGDLSLPNLVLSLDEIVGERADALGDDASRRARKIWGQIEIINALVLDSGGLAQEDMKDIQKLVGDLRQVLFGGSGTGGCLGGIE